MDKSRFSHFSLSRSELVCAYVNLSHAMTTKPSVSQQQQPGNMTAVLHPTAAATATRMDVDEDLEIDNEQLKEYRELIEDLGSFPVSRIYHVTSGVSF